MIRHAYPYAAPSANCVCVPQKCGGIIPEPDCPDHGARKNPAMEWHHDGSTICLQGQGARYRCDQGHPLPAGFQPTGDPDDWDDTCHCTRDKENSMSDDTANHRPTDQDPEQHDGGTVPVAPWDGCPLPGEAVSDVSPF